MAPLRRYLRITKHSVLEVRIYLDRPSDAEAWLLKRDGPALPRVIQAVRPLVLPKLREEVERARGRGGGKAKKKDVKDVVMEDDFEVAIFLTDISSRHSVLTKQKAFKGRKRIRSNSGKLTGWLRGGEGDGPIVVHVEDDEKEEGEGKEDTAGFIVIREEDEDSIHLADIPQADALHEPCSHAKQPDWPRNHADGEAGSKADDGRRSVSSPVQPTALPGRSDGQEKQVVERDEDGISEQHDDKKSSGLDTCYEGFSIYGRVLCLIVKRRGTRSQMGGRGGGGGGDGGCSSQTMLENWVSTQAAGNGEDAG